MAVILNGRSYSAQMFKSYGYLELFPEQLFNDLLAELSGLIAAVPPPPDEINDWMLACRRGAVRWVADTGGGGGEENSAVVNIPAGETYVFPAITFAMWGKIVVGQNVNNADFNVDASGNVQLVTVDSSGLIVANAATSGKICLGGAAPSNPVVLTNRTSSAISVLVTIFYQ